MLLSVLLLAACGSAADVQPSDGFAADLGEVTPAPPPPPAMAARTDPSVVDHDRTAAALQELRDRSVRDATPDAPPPVHLTIPAIGVDTPTIQLDLTADEAEVPAAWDVAGWYRQTRTPGTVGPAVVVGHVGSRHGPGVFHALDQLRPGDEILVTDAEGTVRTFVVDSGALVDKGDRPPEVFGWVGDRPELRLITCGGEFDTGSGHHVSNYVVWAHEVTT